METLPNPQNRPICPECGGPLTPTTSTRLVDWDCGQRSVPTRLFGPLIIVAGFLMVPSRLGLLGLVFVVGGGCFLLGCTEKTTYYQCADCGFKQGLSLADDDDLADDERDS